MVERKPLMSTPPDSADVRIQSEGSPPGTPSAAHELTDARVAPIFGFAAGLSAALALVVVSTAFLLRALDRREGAREMPLHPLAAPSEIPPEPRLHALPGNGPIADAAPPADPFSQHGWPEHDRESAQVLSTYDWIDRQAGIVRIPLERAIELSLEKGFPTAAPPEEQRPR